MVQVNRNSNNFLIVGWYGTETVGDKAILDEIIYDIKKANPVAHIALASLYPFVSKWTLRELGHETVEVIPVYSRMLLSMSETVDEVIMGGGPLMHLNELGYILEVFRHAKRRGKYTTIAGCGIGPLDGGEKYRAAVNSILSLSDVIELRDTSSVSIAKEVTGRSDIYCTGDPSIGFVKRWLQTNVPIERGPYLSLFLREWTKEYKGVLSGSEFENIKSKFESNLGLLVRKVCRKYMLQPKLFPMHSFCIGNDDRDFNRRFSKEFLADLNPYVERKPMSPQEILLSMSESEYCFCMRYHSVVFADKLNVRFLAIDYTQGGKIRNYLSDNGKLNRMISLPDMAMDMIDGIYF